MLIKMNYLNNNFHEVPLSPKITFISNQEKKTFQKFYSTSM